MSNNLEDIYVDGNQVVDILNSMKFPIMGVGGGFAPIGTVNAYMGTVAPIGWLVCDGQTYNISDYPDLATHIASHFGSVNFFGGDGTTTFAVPDLRGEFLRGSGTNSHTNQGSGANVGVHQDGTEHPEVYWQPENIIVPKSVDDERGNKKDSELGNSDRSNNPVIRQNTSYYINQATHYTSRPTNTSVLYIIKAALSDANLDAYTVYSPNEHQVGWWQEVRDGVLKQKPVYEKTLTGNATGTNSQEITIGTYSTTFPSVDDMIMLYGTYRFTQNSPLQHSIKELDVNCNVAAGYDTIGVKQTWTSSSLPYKYCIIAKYTKTTDEWQTV